MLPDERIHYTPLFSLQDPAVICRQYQSQRNMPNCTKQNPEWETQIALVLQEINCMEMKMKHLWGCHFVRDVNTYYIALYT